MPSQQRTPMERNWETVFGKPLISQETAKLLRIETALSGKLSAAALSALFRFPARFHLAISSGAAFADNLLTALQSQGVLRHVAGDHRSGADVGTFADFHRRHQRRIGADEGAGADLGLVFAEAVIVTGD